MKSTPFTSKNPLLTAAKVALAALFAAAAATAQGDLHDTGGHDLKLTGSKSRYVNFSEGFVFPFGGVPHAGVYVHGNGYVSFGGLGVGDASPTTNELLGRKEEFSLATGMMRIAPLWADLDPNPYGRGRVYAGSVGASSYRISWVDVPFRGAPKTTVTVSLVLRSNGSFQFVYDNVPSVQGWAISGFAAGHEHTNVRGSGSDLSKLTGTIGNGTQPHVFEQFYNSFDLSRRTLEFAPVLPTSGVVSLAGDDAIEIDLGFAFPDDGNRYPTVWVGSNGELNFTRWSPFAWSQTESALLDDTARILPFNADLDPTGKGYIRVTRGKGNVVIQWYNLAETEKSNTNTFSVTLRKDGSFSFNYGRVDSPTKDSKVAIGATGGYPVTTEKESQIAFVGDKTYGTGKEAAIYQIFDGKNSGLANKALHFRPFTRKSALPLMAHFGRGSTHRYDFANGFVFPFAGTSYSSMFVNANGTISFGSGEVAVTTSVAEMLDGFPRLAPLWAKHNPKSWQTKPPVEGTVHATQFSDRVEVRYVVPLMGKFNSTPKWNTFTVILEKDGDFSYRYGRLDAVDAVVGYSTGAIHACSCESMQDLSTSKPLNRGSEAATWEQFDGESRLDLANKTLSFRRVGGVTLRNRAAIGGTVGMTLAAGAEHAGLEYIQALSLSAKTGIPLGGNHRFPLDFDPLLEMSLSGQPFISGFVGRLDANGRSVFSQVAVPNKTELAGFTVHSAFLALSAETPGGIAYISDGALIGIAPAQAKVKKCKVTATTAIVGNAWAITVTTTDKAGKARPGVLVSCGLYNGRGKLVMPLQFKNTNGAGTAVFNLNPGVALPRAYVKGLVAADANCPLMRYRK